MAVLRPDRQIYATDDLIERNRTPRALVFFSYLALVCFIPPLVGTLIAHDWLGYSKVGFFLGCVASVVLLSATIDEAQVIAQGTAILLGYRDGEAAQEAMKSGSLIRADYNHARDRFMAASHNIKMNLAAHEYTISVVGLDPDLAAALAHIAPLLLQARQPRQP
jgi:hypothetical protein